MSREDAAENRRNVVETAAELFREHGYDGIGIAALMKAAGLTNGAFYKQFDSKEALIAEATAAALSQNAASWDAVLDKPGDDPRAAIARWYLSEAHVRHRDKGCAYAALAAEAPRHEQQVRQAFDEGIRQMRARLAEAIAPDDPAGGLEEATRFLCQIVGALTLARATSDPDLAEAILSANRTSA